METRLVISRGQRHPRCLSCGSEFFEVYGDGPWRIAVDLTVASGGVVRVQHFYETKTESEVEGLRCWECGSEVDDEGRAGLDEVKIGDRVVLPDDRRASVTAVAVACRDGREQPVAEVDGEMYELWQLREPPLELPGQLSLLDNAEAPGQLMLCHGASGPWVR
ncbi:MAG: hypothetical protein ACXVRH_01345 [Thermoleophilaceae bacterium]